MILHTLNALPDTPAFTDCLALLSDQDTLLLLGDGVYGALPKALLQLERSGLNICALKSDVSAAGLTETLPAQIKQIDFDEFVALTEQYVRQQAWF
ncbi:MAG: sulfur relay protein TusB/DsrH [Alcanivorax sp.]|jgi:sulfur relay protein TusB/DsrH